MFASEVLVGTFVIALLSFWAFISAVRSLVRHRSDITRRGLVDKAVVQFGLPMALTGICADGWFFLFVVPDAPLYGPFLAMVPFMCAVGIWSGLVFLRLWEQ
jgi:hypothetical protein